MTKGNRHEDRRLPKPESVVRKKSEDDLARELAAVIAADASVVESVGVSLAEIAAGDTVSFEEAFGTPGPR